MSSQESFSFEDMKQIRRNRLGSSVPLELFRAIRLIGMYQGLPLHGKGTTTVIGKTIGESLPVHTVDEFLCLFKELKIGIPSIIRQEQSSMRIAVDDCFCEGIPQHDGKFVCDLEGSIIEGALAKLLNKQVNVREVMCNVNGDARCEYEVKFH